MSGKMESMRLLIVLVAVLALAAVAPAGAAAATKTESASSGQVSASLTYDYAKNRDGVTQFSNEHVTVTRAGIMLVNEQLGKDCAFCTPWPASGAQKGLSSVKVRDLDRDGEPEVLVDLFTGGANCCWYTDSYRFDAARGTYVKKVLRPGLSFPYTLKDIDRNGIPEFVSVDYRFAYKYGSNADTPRPLRIFDWKAGRLVDVTRRFPGMAARDADDMYRGYLKYRKVKGVNLRGLLAAYAADSYNARNGLTAWTRVVAAYHRGELNRKFAGEVGPFGAAYLHSLRSFLKKLGYLR
jgi:hypothetical protein